MQKARLGVVTDFVVCVGLEEREFPSAVIERWRQIGRGRPN